MQLTNTYNFEGTISDFSIVDILQFLNLGQKTVEISFEKDEMFGLIYFEKGEVVHAKIVANEKGIKAFNSIINWEKGKFEIKPYSVLPERTIGIQFNHLLLGAIIIEDEKQKLHSEVYTDINKTKLEEKMAINLTDLRNIDGIIGGCMVDSSSGMVMGKLEGSSFDMEIAAAGNTEVIKSKQKTMKALGLDDRIEDVLISLGKHYHIIRPLEKKPELFLYIVLEREKANLAMARHELKALQKKLKK